MYGQVWGEGLPRKRKNLANSYTATRVNVYFKLSSFFPMLFQRQNRDINGSLQILDFFQESFLKRGLHVSMNGKFIFSGKFIFRWRGHLIGVDSALMAEGGLGGKKLMEWEAPYSCLSPLGETLVCVVTGLKRSMNYNMLWKIYKKRILTLQEKALLHR